MPSSAEAYTPHFEDPRLKMSVGGRFFVRVTSAIAVLVTAAAAVTFLISDVIRLRAAGVLLALALADWAIHRKEGDTPISEFPKSGAVNLGEAVTPASFSALSRAFDARVLHGKDFFLAMAKELLESSQVEQGLARLDVKPKEFRQKLQELLAEPVAPAPNPRDECLKQGEAIVVKAFEQALSSGNDFIEITNFFSALARVDDDAIQRLFHIFSIEAGDLERALIFSERGVHRGGVPAMLGGYVLETHRHIRHRVMNRAWTSRPTPTLDRYSVDLTDLARSGESGFMIGHDDEYERLVQTLARPINPNALLVGEAGVGKETVIRHLAFCLVKDTVPNALFDKRLVMLEIQNLIAGAVPEVLNARLKDIVEEINVAGNIILHIPDIHNLVKTSGAAYLSAADALMPVIMNNAFPIVGSTYSKEFKEFIEPRSDFVAVFEVIHIEEISETDAEKILTYEAMVLERKAKITVSFGAVKRAVMLAKKYFHGKMLPSSAEELLKSAFMEAEHRGETVLGPDRVTAVAETKVNIPMHEATAEESQKLLNLEATIHTRLVDQEEAVKAVSQSIREYRSGLTRKGGPIASFLFVGPTGVGKTELAKILAEIQFGSEKLMVRFDMTEYQDKQSFFRFIGSPDGATRGALTEAILEKPYSLILLDEFEKAFPDILNLFLQVLDDGRLTDNLGRTVDFTNTIVIATSNAHSDIVNDALSKGESIDQIAEYVKARLVDVFRAELLNRFSKIVVFKNLEPEHLAKIVEYNLRDVSALVKEQGIFIQFDPDAVLKIAKLGFDPAFGARPLRRVIDEKVRAPLSEALLSKKIVKGSKVRFVVAGDGFDFVTEK